MRALSEGKLHIELEHSSRIVVVPGSEKTVRGFSAAALLIVDEAAIVDDELITAIRPMLAVSGGSLIMLSTPRGRVGAFYEAWENGGEEWQRFRVTARQCPRITDAYLERERIQMGADRFEREFMCEFIPEEGQYIDEASLRAMIIEDEGEVFGSAQGTHQESQTKEEE